MATKVAVVTGANKGIGFGIVRGLCKQFDGDVYLTARDEERGQAAVKKLKGENLNPKFHQLDITDPASVTKLKEFLQEKYQGLDILVNNAGFAYKITATEPFPVQAEETMKINFWGTLDVCNQLFLILRPGARVVMVTSRIVSGMFLNKCTEAARERIRNCKKMEDVKQLMADFVNAAKNGTAKDNGWPETSYGISKVGMTLMTTPLQETVAADTSRPNILVNNCCPGHVDTDMSGHRGPKTIDEGADTPLFLALLPQDAAGPRGGFYSEREPLKWP